MLPIAFATLCGLYNTVFWMLLSRWEQTGTLNAVALAINRHLTMLSPTIQPVVDNMIVGGLEFTIVVVAFVTLFLRKSVLSFLRFDKTDLIVLVVLVLTATMLRVVGDRIYFQQWSLNGAVPVMDINSLVAFVAQFFINGFPEEMGFRGYVLGNLLVFVRQPIVAMWISVILFDAFHLPQELTSRPDIVWWKWALYEVFPYQPTAWVWGYMYFRLKTIVPGAIFHTYTSLWAFYFW